MDKKQDLRILIKQKRKTLKYNLDKIIAKLQASNEYMKAHNIMLYYPKKYEVNLLGILEDSSKKFYLPKVVGSNLLCCPYINGDKLEKSEFNVLEPKSFPVSKDMIDLVIVPALCCDSKAFRLGYGGGFYDRFLENYKGKTVVCLSKDLVVESVFPEKHDIPIQLIITDE